VDDADKRYTGRPKVGSGCVTSQAYQGAATTYK